MADYNFNGVDDEDENTDVLGAGLSVRDASAQRQAAQKAYEQGYAGLLDKYRQAEQTLRDRRTQKWTDPANLLALSAAFFQPTRQRGFAGTMANVMPTLQNIVAQQDADKRKKEDLLREYGLDTSKVQLSGLEKGLTAADRAYAAAVKAAKPPTSHVSANPLTGEMYNTATGFPVPNPLQITALLNNPVAWRAEFDRKFGPGAADRIIQQYGRGGY